MYLGGTPGGHHKQLCCWSRKHFLFKPQVPDIIQVWTTQYNYQISLMSMQKFSHQGTSTWTRTPFGTSRQSGPVTACELFTSTNRDSTSKFTDLVPTIVLSPRKSCDPACHTISGQIWEGCFGEPFWRQTDWETTGVQNSNKIVMYNNISSNYLLLNITANKTNIMHRDTMGNHAKRTGPSHWFVYKSQSNTLVVSGYNSYRFG